MDEAQQDAKHSIALSPEYVRGHHALHQANEAYLGSVAEHSEQLERQLTQLQLSEKQLTQQLTQLERDCRAKVIYNSLQP